MINYQGLSSKKLILTDHSIKAINSNFIRKRFMIFIEILLKMYLFVSWKRLPVL